jgi:ubiquinone/menaquinone biosynthesis C-methylase UbiE
MKNLEHNQTGAKFLDMQAELGITKHIGGYESTKELLSLCQIEGAREVLNIGCGIGVGSTYIAKKYGCHVVGVDISDKMIAWSRRRAKEEGVEAKVEFRTADALNLPFEADRFDVVFAESVFIFIEDKRRAIQECIRVTKPGGHIGLCEGYWIEQPSPDLLSRVRVAVDPCVPTLEDWQVLWENSGLQERVVRTHQVDPRTEVKSRIEWISWRWLLRAWGRALRLFITNPGIRQAIKDQFDVPAEAFHLLGYGLFIGKK